MGLLSNSITSYQSRIACIHHWLPGLETCLTIPGPRPELLRDGQVNQAGNERMLILEGWHDLDPHTAFQPRMFELNVTLHARLCWNVPELFQTFSGPDHLAWMCSFWPGECEFLLDWLDTFERRPGCLNVCAVWLCLSKASAHRHTHKHTFSLPLLGLFSLPCGSSSLCWSLHIH